MPSKYPILKPTDVIKRLQKKGFEFVSQKGTLSVPYQCSVLMCKRYILDGSD